jgi:hypothetical protein
MLGEALLLDRQYVRAERLSRELMRSADKYGFEEVSADARYVLAQAMVAQGQLQEALIFVRQALERYTLMRHFRREMALELTNRLGNNAHDAIPMPMPQKPQSGR